MDKITVDPCNVCGSTDMNLVDGFYYCVECGTQDVNVRQSMLIQQTALADGTFTFRKKRKVTVFEKKNEMPGEWHKWHAYNFILVGLADELIAAGAKPSFKKKLLWLWTEYIKKFQNKEELGLSTEAKSTDAEDDKDESQDDTRKKRNKPNRKEKQMKMTKDVGGLRKVVIFSMLYTALNLDGSDIQMSDLVRFMREGRLDIKNCKKYVPKEINVKLIPGWSVFNKSALLDCGSSIEATLFSISFLKCLSILPRLPDLRKIIEKFIKELCLPKDFQNLVTALMEICPCDHLEVDAKQMKVMVRFPAYECIVMTYIMVAFKMCFGLDDDYDVKISDAVDKINDDNNYLKSYRLGFSEATDRLFSFREWCNFIQLRKIILSKYYLHIGEKYLREIDDYVYVEQKKEDTVATKSLPVSDEIIMKILDKLPLKNQVDVIPKSKFNVTTTPLTTYSDVIMQYFDDPDLKLLFSEDFSKYSLKYAVENLYLNDKEDVKNILLGVSEQNKSVKTEICGIFKTTKLNTDMVYVRNCENKNWLKTNQPQVEHIMKSENDFSDKDSDHGYDSNADMVSRDIEINNKDTVGVVLEKQGKTENELELSFDENEDCNIFDDEFVDIKEEEEVEEIDTKDDLKIDIKDERDISDVENSNAFDENIPNTDFMDINNDSYDQNSNSASDLFFNPNTFDREKVIRELVLACCKKYKIRIPKEYDTKEPKKRKSSLLKDEAGESRPKRPRTETSNRRTVTKPSVVKNEINELLTSYYKNLQNDVFCQISKEVKSFMDKLNETEEEQNIIEVGTGGDPATNPCDPSIENVDESNIETPDNADINETLEQSSVQCINEEDDSNNNDKDQNRSDPRFDEKDYDISQLYVKINDDNGDMDDVFDVTNDPVISEILDKKIAEIEKDGGPVELPPREPKRAEDFDDDDDDDDDIPLSVLKEEKRKISEAKNLPPLVKNPLQVKEFRYWIRQYASKSVLKSQHLNEVFHKELFENYPRSFYFVIKECANMIEITPFELYKAMLNLELRLSAR